MMRILVIGAGLFGCNIAQELAKHGLDVTLIEKENDIMQRASKFNHNRLHLGFHYPRSTETAIQSMNGLLSFTFEYSDAIVNHFPNHYAIAKNGSKIDAEQFANFCDEVGLFYIEELPSEKLINRDFIETSFSVNEPIFDYKILKAITKANLLRYNNIEIKLSTAFDKAIKDDYDFIVNASYEGINHVLAAFNIPPIPLRLQDVVIPVMELDIDRVGLTIMDGPFGSIMPKGIEQNRFLFYHVVESVIEQSYDGNIKCDSEIDFKKIYDAGVQMYPILEQGKLKEYWRTVRALPVNKNDARISELFIFEENKNLISVLSGKIATCKKLAMEIYLYIATGKLRNNIVS